MAEPLTEAEFIDALCARVRTLRVEKTWTIEQMATALGIGAERYRKYEIRSPLPHFLIPRFALIVDRDVQFILTGVPFPAARARPFIDRAKRRA